MQKLISVIVPFFNAKTYLESNLSKWLQQSDAHFELVLVDDGSMDGSGELARAWAERHDHVSVHHKVNGGVSSARNLGLSVARGDLILFVDADDTVEPDFVASMREALVGQDLAVCAYDSVGAQLSVPFVLPQGAPVTLELAYHQRGLLQQGFPNGPHSAARFAL
jgi:glycosyltransferase involved in cell wall biosynthesis